MPNGMDASLAERILDRFHIPIIHAHIGHMRFPLEER